MAFLIRTIDYTAAGREIVRDRTVDQARLTVGRAASSDIHLPDLAVEQHHVGIDLAPDGTLAVKALGTLGFGLDGRVVTEGIIDPRTGGEIALGAARLAVAREADGNIVITIRQVVADEGKVDALRGFALASKLPAKRTMSWVFASAIILLLLALPVASHLLRTPAKPDPTGKTPGAVLMDSTWTSGELSIKHHSLENNCESCHVAAFECRTKLAFPATRTSAITPKSRASPRGCRRFRKATPCNGRSRKASARKAPWAASPAIQSTKDR
jgi:hypothetical protein